MPFGAFYQAAPSEAAYEMKPALDAVLEEHGLSKNDIVGITGELICHADYPDETTVELVWTVKLSGQGE